MEIWPAIDILGGKCVRLRQGDYSQETVFGDSPLKMAEHWVNQGARRLHLVDLDGAKEGRTTNIKIVEEIVRSIDIPCELGGGIRSEESICRLLDAGVRRLVIGTYALENPEWFKEMTCRFPERLVLGIDAKDGRVATRGWLETSSMSAVSLAKQCAELPLSALIFTDIATDGMMQGPNIAATQLMQHSVALPVICSGGITTLEDVRQVYEAGIVGCIIGRALYEGTIRLKEAIEVAVDL